MAHTPPKHRPRWDELPLAVRAEVEDRAGAAVSDADYPSGGFTPGIAARLRFADDSRVFVKGIPLDDPAVEMYRAEAAVGPYLPAGIAPMLRWTVESGGWLALGFEDVSGSNPSLVPGSPNLGSVLKTVATLGSELTPSPVSDARPFAELAETLAGHWKGLVAEESSPWLSHHGSDLVALDDPGTVAALTHGDSLLHCDLRADNMLFGDGRTRVIDWSWFATGAAWVDVAFLLPQLLLSGHSPYDAEQLLAQQVPAWRDAPDEGVVAFAVAITGFWTWQRRHGPGGALGEYRARAAAAGRAWVAHRMGWNEPSAVPR